MAGAALFNNVIQSFPSGHTATSFVLSGILTRLYPRGKPLFLTFAVLTGIRRVMAGNHYPSDVIAGAIIGIGATAVARTIWSERQNSTAKCNAET